MGVIGRTIRERTHGEPPDRASLGGSDDKWDGYLLGVEEAAAVAEEQLAGAVSEVDELRAELARERAAADEAVADLRALIAEQVVEINRLRGR